VVKRRRGAASIVDLPKSKKEELYPKKKRTPKNGILLIL
jgi:hypothetical protein